MKKSFNFWLTLLFEKRKRFIRSFFSPTQEEIQKGWRDKHKRLQAWRRGHYAEYFAAFSLLLKGFWILERRWKTKEGEIDLIARRGNLIVIVEVKARKSLREAMEAVTRQCEKRIEASANRWLAKRKDFNLLSVRFDMIAVVPWRWPIHIENFFQAHD